MSSNRNSQETRRLLSLNQELKTVINVGLHTNYKPRMVHKFIVFSVKEALYFDQKFTKLNYVNVKTLKQKGQHSKSLCCPKCNIKHIVSFHKTF